MITQKNIVRYKLLKRNDIKSLLKSINENKKINYLNLSSAKTLKEWIWQYKLLPSAKSYCYLAKYKKKIIGYYHIPVFKFRINKENYLIGNAQDVGVINNFRRKGIFKELSNFALKDISNKIDLIYTFPNKYSIQNFIKNKFSLIKTLSIFFKPNLFFLSKKTPLEKKDKILVLSKLNNELLNLFKKFSLNHQLHLIRDKRFLNWRYLNTPKGKIKIALLKSKGEIKSAIFYRYKVVFGLRFIIILDYAFKENSKYFSLLVNNLNKFLNLKDEKKNLGFIISGLSNDINKTFSNDFYKLPLFLTPRKILLLSKVFNNKINKDLKNKSWLVTLGDWDIF